MRMPLLLLSIAACSGPQGDERVPRDTVDSGAGTTPPTSSVPAADEDCALAGDEDADGLADCADADCASTCDVDGDGSVALLLGGDDCDDDDPDAFPGAADPCGDGTDQDCDGADEVCHLPIGPQLDLGSPEGLLTGPGLGSGAGYTVDLTPDLTGDGQPDVVVTATGASAAFVSSGPTYGVESLALADATISAEVAEGFGLRAGGAGDIDGDGLEDLAYGVVDHDADRFTVHLFTGPLAGALDLTDAVATVALDAIDNYPKLWSGADVDADGAPDLVLAATVYGGGPGVVFIVRGPLAGQLDATAGGQIVGVVGEHFATTHNDGRPGASDDLDGDGDDDLLLAATYSPFGPGRAYLVLDPPSAVADVDSVADVVFESNPDVGHALGRATATGDLDGDGMADAVLSGSVPYQVFVQSSASFAPSLEWSELTTVVDGPTGTYETDFGYALAVGDLDGDGADDLVVGDRALNAEAGAAFVFAGPLPVGTLSTETDAVATILGDRSFELAGGSVASGTDLDGDGCEDLVLGAVNERTADEVVVRDYYGDPQYVTGTGGAYLVYGTPF